MSTSLIGRLGSSAFRLSTAPESISLAGSCFSLESAPTRLCLLRSGHRRNQAARVIFERMEVCDDTQVYVFESRPYRSTVSNAPLWPPQSCEYLVISGLNCLGKFA